MPKEIVEFTTEGAPADESKEIRDTPAVFVNKFYLTLTPQGAKVTFAEVNSGVDGSSIRSSVYMQLHDLVQLQKLLGKVVTENLREADSGES